MGQLGNKAHQSTKIDIMGGYGLCRRNDGSALMGILWEMRINGLHILKMKFEKGLDANWISTKMANQSSIKRVPKIKTARHLTGMG